MSRRRNARRSVVAATRLLKALLSQFRECRFDPREYRGLSELREYPLCLGQMFKRESPLLLNLV